MRILLVGGTWDLNGGKKSGLIEKMYENLNKRQNIEKITYVNGGDYNELESILKSVINYEVVFWMAYVPNDLPKVRYVKSINPHAFVIGSKRNDNKYTFVEILNRALEQRNNMTIEFRKSDSKFEMMLFDPLGTCWYKGFDLEEMMNVLINRISFVLTTRREHTYKFDLNIDVINDEEFFEYSRKCAEIFHKTIEHSDGVTRFLGNGSFISKDRKFLYVTERDVDKSVIGKEHFVGTYIDNNKVYYSGNMKPSKDTVIQIRLYEKFKNINYMIHSHCYVEDAPFTKTSIPCGALDEIEEIIDVVNNYYNNNYELNYYKINLIGHGCIIMGNKVKDLENTKFLTRHLPERID